MKTVVEASSETKGAFESIGRRLAARGSEVGAMFGLPSLKAGGKAFAGLFGDALVFKLGGETHAGALALPGAELFDPSGMGRAMKEWVVVPKKHAARWSGLAESALEYVGARSTAAAPKAKANAAPAKKRAAAPKTATAGRSPKAKAKRR